MDNPSFIISIPENHPKGGFLAKALAQKFRLWYNGTNAEVK